MLQVVLEYGSGYKPIPGHVWRALFYDRETQIHASESGPTAWEALAWCLVDWQEKQRGLVCPVRNSNDTPASTLAKLSNVVVDKAKSTQPGMAPGSQIRVGSAGPTSSGRNSGSTGDRSGSAIGAAVSIAPSMASKQPAVAGRSLVLSAQAGNDSTSAPHGVDVTFSLAPSEPKSAAARRARTKKTARKK